MDGRVRSEFQSLVYYLQAIHNKRPFHCQQNSFTDLIRERQWSFAKEGWKQSCSAVYSVPKYLGMASHS